MSTPKVTPIRKVEIHNEYRLTSILELGSIIQEHYVCKCVNMWRDLDKLFTDSEESRKCTLRIPEKLVQDYYQVDSADLTNKSRSIPSFNHKVYVVRLMSMRDYAIIPKLDDDDGTHVHTSNNPKYETTTEGMSKTYIKKTIAKVIFDDMYYYIPLRLIKPE